jgi:PncC family amidohydrolase
VTVEKRPEEVAGELLVQSGQTLALAESCTGGLLSSMLTDVAGSSRYFLGSVIAYHDDLKTALLGVPSSLIRRHGAVSAECALQMARGVRAVAGADIGISITGVAGPGGGTTAKPVGTVYIAIAAGNVENAERFNWDGTRAENKERSASAALELLISYLRQAAVSEQKEISAS